MTVPLERILEAIDERTQLISISHVAFRSSSLQDLAAIAHGRTKSAPTLSRTSTNPLESYRSM
jgi:selenocysteine lyase/cysteine desulfurase